MGRELVQISELSTDEKKQINESVPYLPPEVSKFGTSGYCLPKDLDIDYIRHDMTIYPDDIWIVTPPKCGTTWMQEIVWLIHTDVDLKSAQCNQFYRIPFLEECFILPSFLKLIPKPDFELTEKNEENVQAFFAHSFDYVESLQRPRIIKTHLPLELLPDKLLETCKVIYVGRNPKDACVSWWHHCRLHGFNKDFHQMAQMYKEGLQTFAPIVPHIMDAWRRKGHKNLHFTTYESMKKDLEFNVREVARFMGKSLTEKQMETLLKAVDIESFRKNRYVNKERELPPRNGLQFIRKGQIGDWKNHFTPEMSADWDRWIEKEANGTGLESWLLGYC